MLRSEKIILWSSISVLALVTLGAWGLWRVHVHSLQTLEAARETAAKTPKRPMQFVPLAEVKVPAPPPLSLATVPEMPKNTGHALGVATATVDPLPAAPATPANLPATATVVVPASAASPSSVAQASLPVNPMANPTSSSAANAVASPSPDVPPALASIPAAPAPQPPPSVPVATLPTENKAFLPVEPIASIAAQSGSPAAQASLPVQSLISLPSESSPQVVQASSPLEAVASVPSSVAQASLPVTNLSANPTPPLFSAEPAAIVLPESQRSEAASVALAQVKSTEVNLIPLARLFVGHPCKPCAIAPPFKAFRMDAATLAKLNHDSEFYPSHPLSAARAFQETEPALQHWLACWVEGVEQGKPTVNNEELAALLSSTSLSCTQLYEIGRGIEYVDGVDAASPFYRAAIQHAGFEMQNHSRDDPQDETRMYALSEMGAVFLSAHDWANLACVFELIAEHARNNSPMMLSAQFMRGEALSETVQKKDTAANQISITIFQNMLSRAQSDGWPETDQTLLHWVLAVSLYQGGRFSDAASHYRFVSLRHHVYAESAMRSYIISLARAGRLTEARAQYEKWTAEAHPCEGDQVRVMAWIIRAREYGPSLGDKDNNERNQHPRG